MKEDQKNIIPHSHIVNRISREEENGHKACLIWFTGLSGSGKSTIAGKLEEALYASGIHTYLLDGDNVRTGLNNDLGFAMEDRQENLRRISEVARLMVDAGLVVLAAFISPLREDRQKIRDKFDEDQFFEIFVNCPIEECERRDVKGLYAKARKGEIENFTGISSPYEAPLAPEVEVNSSEASLDACVNRIKDVILPNILS